MRLVGGNSAHEGRVEIFQHDAWGTVCDGGWNDASALVVCRELGFPTSEVQAIGSAEFGEGDGLILLDEVFLHGY